MATYAYTALTPSQTIVRGTMTAMSRRLARGWLRKQQLNVITVSRVSGGTAWYGFLIRTVGTMDRILFTRSVTTMLRAGLTLTETLASVLEQTSNPALRRMIVDVTARLHQGQTLSSCLDRYPVLFSAEYRAMIAIGERSGKLVDVFTFLTDKMEQDYRLQRSIRSALTYPALLLVAMIGVVTLMMLFVIPRVAVVYREANVALPLLTRLLVRGSTYFASHIVWIFGGVIAVAIVLDIARQRWTAYRTMLHALWLRSPIFGQAIKKMNLTTISRSLNMLLQAGLSIDHALQLTAQAPSNMLYRSSLKQAVPLVQRGVHLSDIFHGQPHLYVPVFQRMVAAGEQSGNLDAMLGSISKYFDEDLKSWSETIATLLEPAMIIIVGAIVAGIAVSILYPLWNFANIVI